MAEVQIRDVRKAYDSVEVIHGMDFTIPDGEFVVLVGPSGCGKSTLLRMIAGLEGITSGQIAIGDRVVNGVPPSERDIAMVFQNYALYPHKTVRSNMAFALRMRKMDKAEIDRRVNQAAEILGLTPYLDRYPRALSGGQRQRVAMGRAIVRDPEVFLFDEPLSNLDAKLRVQMRAEIRELHQRLKTTTVYVTHDQIEAMTMADRIVVMENGYIRQIGAPLELYDRPANRFVASFIGSPSMNLIEGTVRTGGIEAGGTLVSVPNVSELGNGRSVVFGIRPEDLILSDAGLKVTVSVVEPTGSETHVVCRMGKVDIVAVFRERHPLSPGQEIHLAPATDRVHLFDSESGERLN
ncbi:ABC transporter ATP-binding protein [Silicimonas sp. MF1-12-2]|uniref:ABC transporter ATP-binding protein n=1 Tax=Silicimonas sp. MF1-12-2 TaxID=3384793 RepID=UPI0039B63701